MICVLDSISDDSAADDLLKEGNEMWQGYIFEVCERVSEAQSVLNRAATDRDANDAATVEQLRRLLFEPGLFEALYHIGYLPKVSEPSSGPSRLAKN